MYDVDTKYVNDVWLDAHKSAFMRILFDHYPLYRDAGNGHILTNVPKVVTRAKSTYITESSELTNWFFSEYEICNDEKACIGMKTIYSLFKDSDMYQNMSKKDKRTFNRGILEKQIKKHPSLRGFYRDRIKIDGKTHRSILLKMQVKACDVDDLTEEERQMAAYH